MLSHRPQGRIAILRCMLTDQRLPTLLAKAKNSPRFALGMLSNIFASRLAGFESSVGPATLGAAGRLSPAN